MRLLVVGVAAAVLLAGCAVKRPPAEQRTTVGPTAEQMWTLAVATQDGRGPTFEERRHWENAMDARISDYLARHPEAASSLDVSTFRFEKQAAVGMDKEQIMILLGAPRRVVTDTAEMEKIARRYWPQIRGNATEVWEYPLGWALYFAGSRLVDMTQYLPAS